MRKRPPDQAGNHLTNSWISQQPGRTGGSAESEEYRPKTLSHAQQRKKRHAEQDTVQKKQDDLKVLKERIAKVKALNNDDFRSLMLGYVDLLWKSVEDKSKEAPAEDRLRSILDYLDGIRAFELPANRHDSIPEEQRDAQAVERTSEVHLWSKMTQLQAIRESQKSGISLEGSLGGWLFDGLDFGRPPWVAPVMSKQWELVSARFASHTGQAVERGGQPAVVNAHVLMGLPYDSVLYTTEWEVLKPKLGKQIKEIVVHLYAMVGLGGGVKEMGSVTIRDETGWRALVETGKSNDQPAFSVKIGEIDVPDEKEGTKKKSIVANLSLYMSDADWEMLRKEDYDQVINRAEAHSRRLAVKRANKEVIEPDELEVEKELALRRDRELDIRQAIERFKKTSMNQPLTKKEKQEEDAYRKRVESKQRPEIAGEYHRRYASAVYGGSKVGVKGGFTTTGSQNLTQEGQMTLMREEERSWWGDRHEGSSANPSAGEPVQAADGPAPTEEIPPAPPAPPELERKAPQPTGPTAAAAGPDDPVWKFIRAYEEKLKELSARKGAK